MNAVGWLRRNAVSGNLTARVLALSALTGASLLVAHSLGAEGVGALSLLRVLPWLVGLLSGCGLYGAAPYFLSGVSRADAAYRTTFPTMAVGAGALGAAAWLLAAPLVGPRLFPQLPAAAVLLAGSTVLTQLLETTAKACSQGIGDLPGSNRIIVLEEALFVPAFAALAAAGMDRYLAIVVALALGDVIDAGQGWVRLYRRGFFAGSRPSVGHVRAVAGYGIRSQLSSVALLMNARLDFIIVAALVGPNALGIYAVASRYAELLRMPGLAMNYVLYPRYARSPKQRAHREATRTARRVGLLPAVLAVPMALLAPAVIPFAYGRGFDAAVVPAYALLAGLSVCGVSGIVTAFLFACGRPGLSSLAQGVGLVVTVVLDLTLIPRYGITGAAVASTSAYLTTTFVLLALFRHAGKHVDSAPESTDTDNARVLRSKEAFT